MTIRFNERTYQFRECDTKGMTQADLQRKADESGKMQYEPGATWLIVPGVGYGWKAE